MLWQLVVFSRNKSRKRLSGIHICIFKAKQILKCVIVIFESTISEFAGFNQYKEMQHHINKT